MKKENNKNPNQRKKIRKINITRPITSREYLNQEQEEYTSWLEKISDCLQSDKNVLSWVWVDRLY